MKIVLQKPMDIAVQGKSYPNVAGEPFEVNQSVLSLLDDVKVSYKIVEEIEAPVKAKVPEPVVEAPVLPKPIVEAPKVKTIKVEKKAPKAKKPKKVTKQDGKKSSKK